MFLRMFCSWFYDEKNVRKNLVECQVYLQESKQFLKKCLDGAEKCRELCDIFLMCGDEERALDSLEMYKKYIQYAKEARERNNICIGTILQYESWLDKC
ncbi:MAG: hypothetical protein ACOC80_09635 [Petrotogales bacterium]